MIPLVLSGGSGTRLWPVSRSDWPKQHCHLFEDSLQNMTLKRVEKLGTPWLITSEKLKSINETFLRQSGLKIAGTVYEPEPKNTATAIALFCRWMQLKGQEKEVVSVFPADHLIQNENFFLLVCSEAETLAQKGHVVTLGMSPSFPETGYGYIQAQTSVVNTHPVIKAHNVKKFHEKPDLKTAKKFLADGHYFWNSGIFIFKVETMVQALQVHCPDLWKALSILKIDLSNIKEIYSRVESISIDYAVIEKMDSKQLLCLPVDFGWSDVGSWDAVSEKYLSQGQQHVSAHPVVEIQSENNFVFSRGQQRIALVGVDQLIVVETEDALLITQKGQSQEVKKVVEEFQKVDPKIVRSHGFEVRPWGEFEVLKDTQQFKSKVIRVLPNSQISYQSHTQREEHWIITRGEGKVILNDEEISVKKGSYIFIPVQARHRIKNDSNQVLEFVEVQLGAYFGEDDIIRYQDDYQRV